MLIRLIVLFMFLLMGKVVSADEVICHPPPKDLAQVIYTRDYYPNSLWVEVIVPRKIYDSLKFVSLTMEVEPKNNSTKDQLGIRANLAVEGCGNEFSEDLAVENCDENFSAHFRLSDFKDSLISLKAVYDGICISFLDFTVDPPSPETVYEY